ncbi:MAG: ABC transporter permease [Lachnospiraceae bacterium]|nr:ABC transporter permease [Lachnospiraceae bacterium]
MKKPGVDYTNIPKEKFKFVNPRAVLQAENGRSFDELEQTVKLKDVRENAKAENKPVGWFQDAVRRFFHNRSALAGTMLLCCLILFAVLVPLLCSNSYTENSTDTLCLQYSKLLPKSEWFAWTGWDGCYRETLKEADYYSRLAICEETGMNPIAEVYRADYKDTSGTADTSYYDVRTDSYINNGMLYLNLTAGEYKDIQDWQNENGIQVIYPAVELSDFAIPALQNNADIWYECTPKGAPVLDENGNFVPVYITDGREDDYNSLRIAGDDGSLCYARITGSSDAPVYKVRVFSYTYFQYRYGFEPSFLFGTNAFGQDILTGLAKAARFSLLLAVCVSVINFVIGVLYGAVAGYYGGAVDLVMERLADVLSGVPFIVVTALFQLHLAQKIGVVWALLFAFVLTGWIGMARTTRMQFYRYKKKEYVLAARTMGAGPLRLMFRHIFPNAVGTLITGAVLLIPNVIYAESNLTYLGVVNLDTSDMASIGSMLAAGQPFLTSSPHIVVFPAVYISLLMIAFNLLGNGLRDAFNPTLRGGEDAYEQ